MKTSAVLLALSLAANAALIAFLVSRSDDRGDAARVSRTAAERTAEASRIAAKDSATATPAPKTWDRIRTDDLPSLVARLRAAGFPPKVVRDVVATLVSERFDARRLEIEKANFDTPFWKYSTNSYNDPKIGPELRKLGREQTELLSKLLGGNLADLFAGTDEDRAMLRYQIGNVAPDKLAQLYATAMDYGEKMSQAYSATTTGGDRRVMLDSDRAKINELDQAYRTELAKFLSPAEVTDFMLHNGQTAQQARFVFAPMKLSEDEFRAVYPLVQAFQDQNPTLTFTYLPPDASPAVHAAVDQLNSQIAATLGSDRAADFQQVINPDYNQVNRLVARLDLPLSAAASVVAVQQDIQQRATAVRADDSLDGDARKAQLTALAQEASTKISSALGGQRGLDAYKEYGGQWLASLTPRPKPATPPKG